MTAEDLHNVQGSFSEQLQDCRSVLQAQMMVVRERAEKIYAEFQDVWKDMQSVAFRRDIEPVRCRRSMVLMGRGAVSAVCCRGRLPPATHVLPPPSPTPRLFRRRWRRWQRS